MTLTIRRTETFIAWLTRLVDDRAVARIEARLIRLSQGNPGDVEPIGSGLSELRIAYGPGYRVYFGQRGKQVVVLLIGAISALKTATSRRQNAFGQTGRRRTNR